MTDTLTIPVTATYRIVNGEAVKVAAEYAEVSADTVARLLCDAFNVRDIRCNDGAMAAEAEIIQTVRR